MITIPLFLTHEMTEVTTNIISFFKGDQFKIIKIKTVFTIYFNLVNQSRQCLNILNKYIFCI